MNSFSRTNDMSPEDIKLALEKQKEKDILGLDGCLPVQHYAKASIEVSPKTEKKPIVKRTYSFTDEEMCILEKAKLSNPECGLTTGIRNSLFRLHVETVADLVRYIDKNPFYENKKSYIWTQIGEGSYAVIISLLNHIRVLTEEKKDEEQKC